MEQSRDFKNLKRSQKEILELKSTTTAMKNSLDVLFQGRFEQAEEKTKKPC